MYFDDFKVEHVKSPVIQSEDFYPFGLTFNSYTRENSLANQYLYNKGSERQEELDLNVYQTHYRILDPALGRWWQIDPKASTTYDLSVYSSMNNNPVRYNDPLGDVVEIEHRKGFLGLGGKQTLTYNNGSLTKADGSAYTGKVNGFLGKTVSALNGLGGTATGGKMLSGLQSSTNTFKIVKGASTEFKANDVMKANGVAIANSPSGSSFSAARLAGGSGGTITFNPTKGAVGTFVNTTGGPDSNPTTNLGHELAHGSDADNGLSNNTVHNGLKLDEWQASHTENDIRSQMGANLRSEYNTKAGPVPLLDAAGNQLPFPTLPLITLIR